MFTEERDLPTPDGGRSLRPGVITRPFPARLGEMSGRDVLNSVLDHENPRELVMSLSSEDFYWLLKKVGEDDCLPLLALASERQWQFVLDLEIWTGDRLDNLKTFKWVTMLQQADSLRLARWFFNEGQVLACMYLFRSLILKAGVDDDSVQDLGEGFTTLDGVFYFRPYNLQQAPVFEALLRAMAAEDHLRYQALLSGLGCLIPAETEEDMLRMRNVRLAEHGFLPKEEALVVYSPLAPTAAGPGEERVHRSAEPDMEMINEATVVPLMMIPGGGFFSQVAFSIEDPFLLERMRLEFSGLCNMIMSAEGIVPEDVKDLERVCLEGSGYVSAALEHLCGGNLSRAGLLLKDNAIVTFFRIGFGLALDVGRSARKWAAESWWTSRGLPPDFWGNRWGGPLWGILQPKPVFPSAPGGVEEGVYRGFRSLGEIRECSSILEKVIALDGLMRALTERGDTEYSFPAGPDVTVQALLITLWARDRLSLQLDFAPVSVEEARGLLSDLKPGYSGRPGVSSIHRRSFMDFFLGRAFPEGSGSSRALEEALSDVWEEFRDEYRHVRPEDLDPRFSPLLLIESFEKAEFE